MTATFIISVIECQQLRILVIIAVCKLRQFAWKQGDISKYRYLRNLVQRMAKGLRSKYCNRCVKSLRNAGPKQWWLAVKRITGQSHSMPLTSLAPNGNLDNLANDINVTFYGFHLICIRLTCHLCLMMMVTISRKTISLNRIRSNVNLPI